MWLPADVSNNFRLPSPQRGEGLGGEGTGLAVLPLLVGLFGSS